MSSSTNNNVVEPPPPVFNDDEIPMAGSGFSGMDFLTPSNKTNKRNPFLSGGGSDGNESNTINPQITSMQPTGAAASQPVNAGRDPKPELTPAYREDFSAAAMEERKKKAREEALRKQQYEQEYNAVMQTYTELPPPLPEEASFFVRYQHVVLGIALCLFLCVLLVLFFKSKGANSSSGTVVKLHHDRIGEAIAAAQNGGGGGFTGGGATIGETGSGAAGVTNNNNSISASAH